MLGLRLVAKTVNQDDPYVYHLFYADHAGSPGADLTFFEYPGALPGRAGAGMVYRIAFRVADQAALEFWTARLAAEGIEVTPIDRGLAFADPEGLGLALVVDQSGDAPLRGAHPEIPAAAEILGFDHVLAYGRERAASGDLLEQTLGAESQGDGRWEVRGISRGGWIRFDQPPQQPARAGAGTVHHVAWATEPADHDRWHRHLAERGVASTPVIDRHYFQSIYFREPSGVLYELATKGPGFTVDDPVEQLGSRLILPPQFEPRRSEIEARLTPIPDVSRP